MKLDWNRPLMGEIVCCMDPRLTALAAAQQGVLSSRDARRIDVPAVQLDTLERAGELVRVRRGAYVLGAQYRVADPEERYRLRTRAILRTRPESDAASHHAAVLLHQVDTFGVDLNVIDVASPVKDVRLRSGVRTHPGAALWVNALPTCRVVTLPTALCQVAEWSGAVAAVCSMDDALHDDRSTVDELTAAVSLLPEYQRPAAERAIALTDPASESVGETRTRLLLRDLGFRVISQFKVTRGRKVIARSDFLVDDLVIVEFDGLVKYAGALGRDALAAEKARESDIVDLGYEVIRLIWADLSRPESVAARVRTARERALRRRRGQP